MLVFIIPLKSPKISNSWSHVSRLFERCVRSVCNQTSPDFRCLVVCNEKPDIKFSHPHIEYLEVDLPVIKLDPKQIYKTPRRYCEERNKDKERKILMGMVHARKFEPSYVMPVDADDCVSKRLAEFVNHNSQCNGWFISDGYQYSEGSRRVYLRKGDFNVKCGSCNILRYDLLHFPKNINYDRPRRILPGHHDIKKFMRRQETPLEPLPFPGAIYVTEHGENNYYQKGFDPDNPRLKYSHPFLTRMKKVYKIFNSRPLSPTDVAEFSFYDLQERATVGGISTVKSLMA